MKNSIRETISISVDFEIEYENPQGRNKAIEAALKIALDKNDVEGFCPDDKVWYKARNIKADLVN